MMQTDSKEAKLVYKEKIIAYKFFQFVKSNYFNL